MIGALQKGTLDMLASISALLPLQVIKTTVSN